ncbi:MAG TPA: hypothetical protein VHA35_25700 [Dongiaceae bacterium]|nr:hypothetical protein [Dongiaceae bacterium]
MRPPLWLGAIAVALSAGALAALVVADPYLSWLLPDGLWRTLHIEDWPFQFLPLALAASVALGIVCILFARTGSLTAVGIVLVMIASQTNGFRLSVLDPLDITIFLGFIIWLASRIGGAQTSITLGVVVASAAALMILNLPNILHEYAGQYLRGNFSLLRCVLIALLIPNLIRSSRGFDFAVGSFISVAVASAVVGIGQFVASYFFGFYFTLIDPPETAFKPTPIGMVMRSSSLCITAQHYSAFLMLATPFMLFALTRPKATPRFRIAMLLGIAVVQAGLLVSWNFGAIMVDAVAVILLPFVRWPRFSIQFVVTYLLAAGAAYFSGFIELVYDLTFGDAGVAKGVSQRATLIELGLTKLYRNPWIGTGAYGMADFSGNFWGRPVHDAYVQTMSEIGMVGGWVFIGMFAIMVTQLLLAGVRATQDGEGRLRPCLIAIIALMALMISEPDMDNSNTWLILGLAETAILVGQGRRGFRVNMRGAMSAIEARLPRPSEAETARSAQAE